MTKCYDYSTGRLSLEYKSNMKFNLELRKPKTQIDGNSGTGKTLLVSILSKMKQFAQFSNHDYDVSNIVLVTRLDDISKIYNSKESLIIIDKGDLLLNGNNDLIDYITMDHSNHYLIFSRVTFSLGLSPNYFGELVVKDGVICVQYAFSEEGWF